MNNIEQIIVRLKTRVALAELIGPDVTVSASDLSALIAQLEAAQKERDDLREKVNQADSEWHKMADRILSAGKRAEKAEAALSAANEKLKGEQVPVAVIVLSKNWPDTGRKVIDYYIEKIQHLPVGTELFTAPQKPVVLSSSTVMSRAYVVQAIKAAGFTVEGE
ncbi:5'-nucleotidase [Yersinia intermedia]|uniref:5'-nucleotidase n=1 Tax=Yersinia intermedia TaxID=631 RepID=UPI001CFEDB98|nr:5'-nucleotidase [Yersinia intermedia]MCB5313595.1 5'-nucleotidase [Yersinia intermedia]